MSTQLPDVCRNRHHGNPESEAANTLIHPRKAIDRARILAYADSVGDQGITVKDVIRDLGMKHQSASARLSEMRGVELQVTDRRREGCGVLIRPKGQLSFLGVKG